MITKTPNTPPTTPMTLQIVLARAASGSVACYLRSTTIVFTEAVTPSATSTTTT
jgi:hypothetical protein